MSKHTPDCTCKIKNWVNPLGRSPHYIEYCPLHEAAEDLLEALHELQRGIYDFADIHLDVKNFVYRITAEAIAKARA